MSAPEKKMIRVTLMRGLRGSREDQRASVRGLGLRRREHTVQVEDTPSVRGMIRRVAHLVKCED